MWSPTIFIAVLAVALFQLGSASDVIELYPPGHDQFKEETVEHVPSWGTAEEQMKDRKYFRILKGNGCKPYIKCWHTSESPSCRESYVAILDNFNKFPVIMSDVLDNGPWTHSEKDSTELQFMAGVCASNGGNQNGFSCYFICRA